MKMSNLIKGISLLVCALLSQAAFAQQEISIDRNDLNGILDPNPEQFYCQEFFEDVAGCSESEACEIAVCGVDSYCCDEVDGEWDDICISEAQSFTECQREEATEAIARFKVDKYFDDLNPAEVEVTITCNTGLPLEQSDDISSGDGVTFVVTDFNDGEMDCEVVETSGPDGYVTGYFSPIVYEGEDGCQYSGVNYGLTYDCDVINIVQPVDVTVIKEWIDEKEEFNAINYAQANYGCSGTSYFYGNPYGSLSFYGNPGEDSFEVYPHWDGNTTCWVTESITDSGIETDDSDCASISVTLGSEPECTIVNTRLYEGIPTLSQYGLALLAMLMLGVGFVTFRRLV